MVVAEHYATMEAHAKREEVRGRMVSITCISHAKYILYISLNFSYQFSTAPTKIKLRNLFWHNRFNVTILSCTIFNSYKNYLLTTVVHASKVLPLPPSPR